jgi:hypothetical protein
MIAEEFTDVSGAHKDGQVTSDNEYISSLWTANIFDCAVFGAKRKWRSMGSAPGEIPKWADQSSNIHGNIVPQRRPPRMFDRQRSSYKVYSDISNSLCLRFSNQHRGMVSADYPSRNFVIACLHVSTLLKLKV